MQRHYFLSSPTINPHHFCINVCGNYHLCTISFKHGMLHEFVIYLSLFHLAQGGLTGIHKKITSCENHLYTNSIEWNHQFHISFSIIHIKTNVIFCCWIYVAFNMKNVKNGHPFLCYFGRCSGKLSFQLTKFIRYEIPNINQKKNKEKACHLSQNISDLKKKKWTIA